MRLRLTAPLLLCATALATAAPAHAAPVDLLTRANIRLDGAAANDIAGVAVASAGDVNGDGRPDVIVGAYNADNNSRDNSGSAYVIYGSASATSVDLAALGAKGFRIDGAAAGDAAGVAVSAAGDVNDDERDDVIVGASTADVAGADSGAAYVVYGSATPTNVDLAALGARGFRMGGAATGDYAGHAVSGAGDVNGDGIADVAVGADRADNNLRDGSGSVYVVYGSASPANVELGALTAAQGRRVDGAAAGDAAGLSVSGAGDIDGDGRAEIVVGAPTADYSSRTDAGVAYVVYGSASPATNVDLSLLTPAQGFRIGGAAAGHNAGGSVAAVGLVNADARPDLVIGARFTSYNGLSTSGSAYVIYGPAAAADIDLNTVAPASASGFRIDGGANGDALGQSVSGAGDANADGRADVVVGAFLADNNGRNGSGSAYVVYGPASPSGVDVGSLPAATGYRIDGAAADNQTGYAVAGAGDFNGDGKPDVIVGAYQADNNGRSNSGSAYVVSPDDTEPVCPAGATIGTAGNDTFNGTLGNDVYCGLGGDDTISGAGGDDILVGGPGADTIDGGNGSDQINGGSGADVITGGSGDASTDRMRGGAGADSFDVGVADPGIDRVLYDDHIALTNLTLGNALADDGESGEADNVSSEVESVTGSPMADTVTGVGTFNNTLSGGAGADVLNGGPGADFLAGGAGGDTFTGGDGADRLTYHFAGTGYTPSGGARVTADDTANDGGAAERDNVGRDIESLYGSDNNDILNLSGYNASPPPAGISIFGLAGNDTLTGTAGNDYFDGGANTATGDKVTCNGGTDILVNVEGPNTGC